MPRDDARIVPALPASALEGVARREWTASGAAADALPYVDATPGGDWRARVDQAVAEEMRRMKSKGRDRLDALAPSGDDGLERRAGRMVADELARVASGRSMVIPDTMRYRLDPPPRSERESAEAWEKAIENARAQLEHQATRRANLELALKYAPAAWRARNAWGDAAVKAYEEELARVRTEVNELNVMRKLQQESAAKEISALEREWYATTRKCAAIEGAIADLEAELATK